MQTFLRRHPWSILAAGALIQIVTGIPSAWGVFQQPVCQGYGLAEEDAALAFSFILCFYGIGCVIGGFLQDKTGPRAAGLAGAGLLAAGFLLGAFAVPAGSPVLLYALFSAPVGMGCAFLYPAVMSCAQKWYAGRKGLATGVIGAGVGFSGAALTALGGFLTAALGIRGAFGALGVLAGAVCAAGAALLEDPPPAAPAKAAGGPRCSPGQMVRTRPYWLLAGAACLAAPSVLLFSPVILELAGSRGLPRGGALACIWAGSLCSAAGRLVMPWASDHIGRRGADLLLFAALAALSAAFAFAGGWWVLAVYCGLCFCYAGQAAVLPAAVTDLFGTENSGVNYGFVALGMSAGSVGFPLAARALGLQAGRHWLALAAAAAGFCLVRALRPARSKGP